MALGSENYLLGEPDYMESEFGDLDQKTDFCVVYRDGEDLSECGAFRVNENLSAKDLKAMLEEYLKERAETTKALSDLYPAQTLTDNLSYLQNADIITGKHCVYYLVMSEEEKSRRKRQSMKCFRTDLTSRQAEKKDCRSSPFSHFCGVVL